MSTIALTVCAALVLFWVVIATGFLVWAIWSLAWHLYDTHMQNRLRIKNSDIDAAYTTGQFTVPYSQRDFK